MGLVAVRLRHDLAHVLHGEVLVEGEPLQGRRQLLVKRLVDALAARPAAQRVFYLRSCSV